MQLKDIVVSKQNIRDQADESESFENLVESIKKDSLIQRIVLRPSKQEGMYEVIAGGRRFRALCSINPETYELQESEYALYPDMNDEQALLWSIEENTQRLEFSPMELNRAGLALNAKGLKDKEIAQKLNVTPHRLKRILNLSTDFNKMPDMVIEQLSKLSEDAVLTDAHWAHISEKLDDKEVIAEVAEFIIDKEVPAKDVPSIIKMVEKNRKAQEADHNLDNDTPKDSEPADTDSDPMEYSHKGELLLVERDGKTSLRVIGKGEEEEIPVDQYLNYLRYPEKFKCYVTFKLKIKPID
jgi:ParB family chromosome partitioning protein